MEIQAVPRGVEAVAQRDDVGRIAVAESYGNVVPAPEERGLLLLADDFVPRPPRMVLLHDRTP